MISKKWKTSWDADESQVIEGKINYGGIISGIIFFALFVFLGRTLLKLSEEIGYGYDTLLYMLSIVTFVGGGALWLQFFNKQTFGFMVTNKRVAGKVGEKIIEFPLSDIRIVSVEKEGLLGKSLYITTCSGTHRFMWVENAEEVKKILDSYIKNGQLPVNVDSSEPVQPTQTTEAAEKKCCPKCNSVIEDADSQFCGVCGYKFEK